MLDHGSASPADASSTPAPTPPIVRHAPEFSGRAGEYFGIWIVNLLLGIVTFGLWNRRARAEV